MTKSNLKEKTVRELLDLLNNELQTIANDIEKIPFPGFQGLSNEDVASYQNIDFSSQKLKDFSKILNKLSQSGNALDNDVPEQIRDIQVLEYTRDLLAG
ncbi:MAG: hypothetical protein COC23_06215 [Hyphomicrobiales bacterium]|nr:MAG: hypothetical protein COC23_06215 [Hyphomicrobiales bacterium]